MPPRAFKISLHYWNTNIENKCLLHVVDDISFDEGFVKWHIKGHIWHSYLRNVCMVSDCEYLLGSSGLEPQADVRGIGPVLHFFRSSAHASRVLEQVHAGKANRWTWRGLPCFCLGLLQPQRLQVQASYHSKMVHTRAEEVWYISLNGFLKMTFHAVCNTALSEWKPPAKF